MISESVGDLEIDDDQLSSMSLREFDTIFLEIVEELHDASHCLCVCERFPSDAVIYSPKVVYTSKRERPDIGPVLNQSICLLSKLLEHVLVGTDNNPKDERAIFCGNLIVVIGFHGFLEPRLGIGGDGREYL
jgi:hypothetical protein